MSSDAWNPGQYEKFKAQRSQPFLDLMNLLRATPRPEILDLGCGTGELTALLHRNLGAARTRGMDSSPEMLKKAEAHQEAGLQFFSGDIEQWRENSTCDILVSNAALQWCSNHPDLFRRLYEALRPGGQLAVQMPMNHDYPTHVLAHEMSQEEPWFSLLKKQSYDKYSNLLSAEEYARLLFHLGFSEQQVALRVYPHVLSSREDVIEWVRGSMLTYFQSRLAPQDYQGFEQIFRERLFEKLPDEKPFFYPFKRLLLWARRPAMETN